MIRYSVTALSVALAVYAPLTRQALGDVLYQGFDNWTADQGNGIHTNADGWALSDAVTIPRNRFFPYDPVSPPKVGLLLDAGQSTNTYVRTPLLTEGANRIAFRAIGTADGNSTLAIESSPDGNTWTLIDEVTLPSGKTWYAITNDLEILESVYLRLFRGAAPDDIGLDEVFVTELEAIAMSNARHSPPAPTSTDSIHIAADVGDVHPLATNLVLYARYRFDQAGPFAARPMVHIGTNEYRTATPIPAGRAGRLDYYVEATFDGLSYSSVVTPEGAPSNAVTVIIADAGGGTPDRRQLLPCNRRSGLVITEIMYNPRQRDDMRDMEFVEIFNSEPFFHDLSGYRLSGEVDYTFPDNTLLEAHSHLVVAASPMDITEVSPVSYVLGPYSNRLANGGGVVRLRNRSDAVLVEADYNDNAPWPTHADGAGHSLVLARPDHGEDARKAWDAGAYIGGSPGFPDIWPEDALSRVVINEFLAHTDLPDIDYIELFNGGTQAVDVGGCVLSDTPETNRFVIPPGTEIPARGFLAYDTNALGFALGMAGGDLYLVDTNHNRVVDALRYPAQANGVSSGRYPDGGSEIRVLAAPTIGTDNSGLAAHDIVINEIMYHPISEDNDDEYVELYNRGTETVDLSLWRFTDGISFTFPEGTELAAGDYLVVARSAALLIPRHPQLNSQNTLGDYGGRLSDRGERVVLSRPDDLDLPDQDFVVVDTVEYGDGERWGKWADGGGSSLELKDPRADNRRAMNWAGSDETAKSAWTVIEHTGTLDNGRDGFTEALREIQLLLLDEGECLIDDIEVHASGGANLLSGGTFETGVSGWILQGNHESSGLESSEGFESLQSLHVRATGDGDNGANRIEKDIASGLSVGQADVTIRAMGRWLAGHRDVLLRLQANHLEAVGTLDVPTNLGTPGLPNSRAVANPGPAIHDVAHTPLMPAAGEDVVVSAAVHDPDGIASVTCRYRVDPYSTEYPLPMNDDGVNGDRLAGDGVYSATLPDRSANILVVFHIEAEDAHAQGATSTFPSDAPVRECHVMFGQSEPAGTLGSYRLWLTEATRADWDSDHNYSNEPRDATLIYSGVRAIYNAGVRFRGSPFIRRGYGNPETTHASYVFRLDKDDRLLGADGFNLDRLERDPAYQSERTSFWIGDQLEVPFSHQRYLHVYVNEHHKGTIYSDSHYPNRGYLSCWYPGDPDGDLFEIDDWFEFRDDLSFQNVNSTIQDFTTTGGTKKQARYRWCWEKKPATAADDGYQGIFAVADAMNTPLGRVYDARIDALIDIEQWMRTMGTRRIVGDWDGYGFARGKNTYTYKPVDGRWKLLLWDLDFSLGAGSRPATDGLFSQINDPVLAQKFFVHPRARRAFWRAMEDAVNGPLAPENHEPMMWAVYDAFVANGLATSSPQDRINWMATRRAFIGSQMTALTNAAFEVDTEDFSTGTSPAAIVGSAPVSVLRVLLNGVEHPVYWTSETEWEATVALAPGENLLQFSGVNSRGETVGTGAVTATYTGAGVSPLGYLVINEIMYHATSPSGDFVEIHNLSPTHTFPLEGLHIEGIDFTFGPGRFIEPGGFVVVTENEAAYQTVHGNAEVLAGRHPGSLDNGGETLSLQMPDGTNAWILLDKVRYDDDAPWPTGADGLGYSIQLIDPTSDNNRIANWNTSQGLPQPAAMSTPGAPNNVAGELPAFPAVWLNEVMPSNTVTLMDNAFEYEPWIELFNADDSSVALGDGYYMTDNPTNLTKWAFPTGLTIAADGYLTVYADGQPAQTTNGFVHTSWRMNSVSGVVVLAREYAGQVYVLDVLAYEPIDPDYSYGSYPEGQGSDRQLFHFPSPGSANSPTSLVADVCINEWMADNDSMFADPADGNYEDWFELYNYGDSTANLGGFSLTDDLSDTNRFVIPGGTLIPSGQFLLVWADKDPEQNAVGGDLHTDFSLSKNGELIALFAPDGTMVDLVTFGPQATDTSEGRWPDGAEALHAMIPPTPGASNRTFAITTLSIDAPENAITWNAESGKVYVLSQRNSLSTGEWQQVGVVTAVNATATLADTNAAPHRVRFYRILQSSE